MIGNTTAVLLVAERGTTHSAGYLDIRNQATTSARLRLTHSAVHPSNAAVATTLPVSYTHLTLPTNREV